MADNQRTIMVVEDDPQILRVVELFLKPAGYRVVCVGDPLEAAERVRSERPDLVLSDIAMPELDGYGVLRALQSDPETAGYPVMFLTGNQDFGERVRAFRFGVVDYLTKPFSRDVLLRKIERVLEGLAARPGRVETTGGTSTFLEELQREARSGVLTATGEHGEVEMVVRAGEVVGGDAARLSRSPRASARFEEIDPRYEDVAASEPVGLPESRLPLPAFDEIPEPLRVALVADDNPVFRRFLNEVLGARGFVVVEAADGEEALRLALMHRPGVVLVDARMPGMDGFELCRRLRAHTLTAHTPVLFLSGWDDYLARRAGLEAGADDFLSKETSVRELLSRVRLLMQRYLQPGPAPGAAMHGQMELIGAPSLLQVGHLSRLTGTLSVEKGSDTAEVGFRTGEIVNARCADRAGVEAVWALLAWERGGFRFTPGEPAGQAPIGGGTFEQLLLEGSRRLDESRRSQP
jgi:DNA-binding response OmpR family regulator